MTKPTEVAFHRADELSEGAPGGNYRIALATHLQQVSDAAKATIEMHGLPKLGHLAPFILPEPVDPLEEILRAAFGYVSLFRVKQLREALTKLGFQITETHSDR